MVGCGALADEEEKKLSLGLLREEGAMGSDVRAIIVMDPIYRCRGAMYDLWEMGRRVDLSLSRRFPNVIDKVVI